MNFKKISKSSTFPSANVENVAFRSKANKKFLHVQITFNGKRQINVNSYSFAPADAILTNDEI